MRGLHGSEFKHSDLCNQCKSVASGPVLRASFRVSGIRAHYSPSRPRANTLSAFKPATLSRVVVRVNLRPTLSLFWQAAVTELFRFCVSLFTIRSGYVNYFLDRTTHSL